MSTINNKLTVQEWTVLYDSFKTEKTPDVDALRKFLESPYRKAFTSAEREHYHYRYMQALRLKLEALTTKPSSIEKTMTRSQLFLTDSPLWTIDIKPRNIIEILEAVKWSKQHEQTDYMSYIFDNVIDFDGNVNYVKLNKLYQ
mgnify:FL=1